MPFEPKIESEASSTCRALVPLTVTAEAKPAVFTRADAAFIVQLAANVKGFSQYRAKRRVQPEDGASRYRTTVADALAQKPKGNKLNYVA